ncbi:MAG: hypothetical protein ACXVPD_11125, partial [Bacteroidia bacterium]
MAVNWSGWHAFYSNQRRATAQWNQLWIQSSILSCNSIFHPASLFLSPTSFMKPLNISQKIIQSHLVSGTMTPGSEITI